MITHTVMFKFPEPAQTLEAKRLLETLPPLVPQIKSLWIGLDGTGSPDAFSLVLVTTHDSWDDLKGYAEHPEHVARTAFIREHHIGRASVDSES